MPASSNPTTDQDLIQALDDRIERLQKARDLMTGMPMTRSRRGGRRPGAGRPKGSTNKRSKAKNGRRTKTTKRAKKATVNGGNGAHVVS